VASFTTFLIKNELCTNRPFINIRIYNKDKIKYTVVAKEHFYGGDARSI
jgi:hypothetical protein